MYNKYSEHISIW